MIEKLNIIGAEPDHNIMVNIIKDMLENEKDIIANLSNISSIINLYMDRVNWVGFYLLKGGELVLGPFQGKPACIRIKPGKGVCGKAVSDKTVVIVDNVHEFPGHIACDNETNSEIVLPIYKENEIFGVLDLDSLDFGRFTSVECECLMQVCVLISNFLSKSIN